MIGGACGQLRTSTAATGHATRVDVLLRDELLDRVGGRTALDRCLADRSWQRVLRGAYVPGDLEVDLGVRARAAQRLLPARCLVADRCLLWLLGVDVLPPGPPQLEVVVPRGAVVPARRDVHARVAALPARDRVLLGVLPVLRPARAVADLLRALPAPESVVVADAALHAQLLDEQALHAELHLHAGLRGVRRARDAVDRADGRAESPQETRTRLLLVAGGLVPVPQLDVLDRDGRWLARVDLGFPDARVAVEFDGREAHLQGPGFVHERRRQNALLAAGWLVLRYAADLRERPAAVVAEVRAALVRAA